MITNNLKKRIFTSLLLFILFFLIYNFNFFLIYSLIVLGVLSLIEFYNAINKIIKSKLLTLSMNSIFSIFVSAFCYLFLFFSFNAQLKLALLNKNFLDLTNILLFIIRYIEVSYLQYLSRTESAQS